MQPQITEQFTRYDGNLGVEDYFGQRRKVQENHRHRVSQAAKLISDVAQGRTDPFFLRQLIKPTHQSAVMEMQESYPGLINLREAPVGGMSISDFSILTIDVLDRVLFGYYNATPVVSMPLVKRHTLTDFRLVSRYMMDGAVDPPELVAPGAEPPEKRLSQQAIIQYQPQKYEAFTRVVWEAMVNDDLGAFNDLAQRLTIGANRGIEMYLTGLYLQASGLNTNLYNAGFTNIINQSNGAASDNPPLSIQGIQDAFKVLAAMKDPSGYPIVMTGKMYLWYGPSLIATAQNLMHMMTAQLSVNGGTANAQGFPTQFIEINNWAVQNMTTIMNPFIPLVVTAAPATTASTIWGLTLDPNVQNRPSIEFGTLRGFESPQIFMKVPNTMRAGGGVDASLGDFYTMSSEIKVLTVYGGKQIDGRSTVASTGQGV